MSNGCWPKGRDLDWVKPASGERLVVLGADGFIGRSVVRLAVGSGASVAALMPDDRWCDGAGRHALERALIGADALALLAYEPPPENGRSVLDHELEVNARGARCVAEIAGEHGVRTVFASSAEVYGDWCDRPVREDDVPSPSRPYAVAKLEAERLVGEAADRHGVTATCLRISTVFGPGENRPRAIPAFIRAHMRREPPVVHGDGSDVHDYVFVDDVAGAILNACRPDSAAERVVNVGSGVGRSTLDVLRTVNKVMGAGLPARHEPSPRPATRLVLDPARAERQLAFRPRMDFEAALADEVAWLSE